jgi:hypothetical protein
VVRFIRAIRLLIFILPVYICTLEAAELSMPVTWRAHGWFYRYHPVDEHFFLDAGIEGTVDVVAVDAERIDSYLFIGGGLDLTMGWQNDGLVIFDPRDAHYSMVAGLRFETRGHMLEAVWLHDCFHDIDYFDDLVEIWNVARFDFYDRNWFPRYRREAWRGREGSGLILDYAYSLTFWFFPHWKVHEWIQHDHDFSTAFGGGLKLAVAHRGSSAVELRPNLLFFYDRGGEVTCRNNILLYLTHYGEGGTICLFTGPRWDTQHIKPSGERWLFGLDIYL